MPSRDQRERSIVLFTQTREGGVVKSYAGLQTSAAVEFNERDVGAGYPWWRLTSEQDAIDSFLAGAQGARVLVRVSPPEGAQTGLCQVVQRISG